jgi:hypothetical protein
MKSNSQLSHLVIAVAQAGWHSASHCVLRFGRESGLMSPSRTTFSACSLAAKLKKRERLILPIGSSNARRRTGAIGDRGSTPMVSFERTG